MNDQGQYLGRFAPSPTGELHFGSLVAAMASYCDAKHNLGEWLLRIDDIDPPREANGATQSIINTLKAFGFAWDREVLLQSTRSGAYRAALNTLSQHQLLYCCTCSRRDLSGSQHYPRHCLPDSLATAQATVMERLTQSATDTSVRLHIRDAADDPVLLRKDGLFAYALACAIDDADGITHVVRGADLLNATSHQVAVMRALGVKPPQYTHIPIATDSQGQKLSKQTQATVLDPQNAIALLTESWAFLGQESFAFNTIGEFWDAAISRWQINKLT